MISTALVVLLAVINAGSTGSEGVEGWAGKTGSGWSVLDDLAPTVSAVPYFGFVSTQEREGGGGGGVTENRISHFWCKEALFLGHDKPRC